MIILLKSMSYLTVRRNTMWLEDALRSISHFQQFLEHILFNFDQPKRTFQEVFHSVSFLQKVFFRIIPFKKAIELEILCSGPR